MHQIQVRLAGRAALPRPIAVAGGEGLAAGCYDDVIDEFARKKWRLSFAHK